MRAAAFTFPPPTRTSSAKSSGKLRTVSWDEWSKRTPSELPAHLAPWLRCRPSRYKSADG
eukprot:767633-Hanusia_phi.AAC.12